jgi:hypothetical protein
MSALANQNPQQSLDSLQANGRVRETLAKQIKLMIANGKQLEDREAMALAQYAVATDLNPFSGECYYIPSVGPTPGIAGWRKKGQEQLEYEDAKAHGNGCHFWIEEVDLSADEKAMLKDGDIAASVDLRDSVTNQRWRQAYLEMAKELKELGATDPLTEAKLLVGKEPKWTGFGIVHASESFAYNNGPEKMTRKERALKRAEKISIRKRFPRINLPEVMSDGPEPEDVIDGFVQDSAPQETPEKLVEQLGYGPQPVVVNQDNPLLKGLNPDNPAEGAYLPTGSYPPMEEESFSDVVDPVNEDPDYPAAEPEQPSLLDTAVKAGAKVYELAGKPRSWTPEAVNAAIEFTTAKDQKGKQIEAVNMLNFSGIDPKTATGSLVKTWSEYYRQCRDGGMTPQESAAAADEEILK